MCSRAASRLQQRELSKVVADMHHLDQLQAVTLVRSVDVAVAVALDDDEKPRRALSLRIEMQSIWRICTCGGPALFFSLVLLRAGVRTVSPFHIYTKNTKLIKKKNYGSLRYNKSVFDCFRKCSKSLDVWKCVFVLLV